MVVTPFRSGHPVFLRILLPLLLTLSASLFADVEVPDDPLSAWRAPLASQSLLIALDVVGERIFTSGERGHILTTTTDQPAAWQQANVDAAVLLNAVDLVDRQHGWAVGHDAVILATTDGGQHWQTRFKAVEEQRPLFDVWFKDVEQGLAVGAYGYLLRTTDSGNSWQSESVSEEYDYHLNAIDQNDNGDLYIAAEAGYVYRSEDDGNSWQILNPPYEGSFFDVLALEDFVMVVGLRGHAFYSHDKGQQWQALETNVKATLTGVTRLHNGSVLMVGHAGVVLLVDAAFQSVAFHRLESRTALSDVVQITENKVMLAGEHGASVLNLCDAFARELAGVCQ